MKKSRCMFFLPHVWVFITPYLMETNLYGCHEKRGLFQCVRCKQIARGLIPPIPEGEEMGREIQKSTKRG